MVSIIAYAERYLQDFKRLNLEWLDKYDLTEQYDLEILDDPRGSILDKGGTIFMAMINERVVGSAGLSKKMIQNMSW